MKRVGCITALVGGVYELFNSWSGDAVSLPLLCGVCGGRLGMWKRK